MCPVADDFAAVAQRLKEIQAESAKELSADTQHDAGQDHPPQAHGVYDDMTACA